jgi:hypothetical protein
MSLESLGNLFMPVQFLGDGAPGGASGNLSLLLLLTLVLLILGVQGLRHARGASYILTALGANTVVLLVWSWPFTGRLWVPIFPLLLIGLVVGCRSLRNAGPWILGGLTAASLFMNVILVVERAGATEGAMPSPADQSVAARTARALAAQQQWLAGNLSGPRGDVVLGGILALCNARELSVQGAWMEPLLPPRCFLTRMLRLERAAYSRPCKEELIARLSALQERLPAGGSIYVPMGPTLSPRLRRLVTEMKVQGVLRTVFSSWGEEFEVLRYSRPASEK